MDVSQKTKDIALRMKNIAKTSKLQSKHCSALMRGTKVFHMTTNSRRTKFHRGIFPCGHSEIVCLHKWNNFSRGIPTKKKRRHLRKMTLVVVRVTATGEFGNSKPCIACLNFIKSFQIKTVVYSDGNGKLVQAKTKDLDRRDCQETSGFIQVGMHCRRGPIIK
jgi:hypothetical protein